MNAVKRRTNNGTKRKHFWRKSGAGFTLIELLIVAAIFSLTSLLATTIFSNVQSSQRAISSQQRVTADGRYIIETIAQSIRTGTINYARENSSGDNSLVLGSPATENILSTVDAVGVVTCYRLNPTTHKVDVLTNTTVTCGNTSSAWTTFTPEDLYIDTLKFYITPVSDPFRPVPRLETDCHVASPLYDTTDPLLILAGFARSLGACVCRNDLDCFTGQTCTTTVLASGPTPAKLICTNPNTQPQVTIYLKSHSTAGGSGEQASATLQTTVVSRVYQR